MQTISIFAFIILSLFNVAFARPQLSDIIQTAISDGRFQILLTSLTAADLVTPLKSPGPFTVFAPTDAAFAKLPPSTLVDLLKPQNKPKLIKVLTYHVVAGKALTAADIIAMNPPFKLEMFNNMSTEITLQGGKVLIDNSTVIQADIMASNGIIHAIDTVIIPADIVDIAVSDGRFKTLVIALTAADLVTTLKSNGPFTVFAPTDEAFAKLPPGTLDDLLKPENKPKLIKILLYHVVAGRALTAADIIAMNPPFKLEMANGLSTDITLAGSSLKINDATVTQADVVALNGVIHVIDTVIIPADIVDIAVSDGRFKTLVTALTAADLVTTLKGNGPFTVFAPTDEAFAKLPPGTLDDLLKPENKPKLIKVLTYHVVAGKALTAADIIAMNPPFKLEMFNNMSTEITLQGGKVLINNSTVIQADVMALNGVIHVIDTVILPADIVDIAVSDGRFKTLVIALTAADLVSTLKGNGPFTVFAPTDEAFAKLPPGTLDDLLKPENKPKLIKILLYHVVTGRALTAADIIAMNPPFKLEMANGLATDITLSGSSLKINDATVTQADVIALNGVIHVIDTVIIPQ